MALADKVETANARWHERSVRRFFESDERDGDPDRPGNFGISAGFQRKTDDTPPRVIVRLRSELPFPKSEVTLEVSVRFSFEDGVELERGPDLYEFITGDALEVVAGMTRGALVDALRSVGQPAAVMPIAFSRQLKKHVMDQADHMIDEIGADDVDREPDTNSSADGSDSA